MRITQQPSVKHCVRRKEIANYMNEPLKHKLFSVYGQILNRKALDEAWKHVKANKGAEGVDRVTIQDFDKNLDENLDALLKSLKEKTYKPSPVRRVYIPKKNGKMRPLGVPTIKDRIVQQALTDKLSPFFEANVFHDNSCGFRTGRDAELAVKKIISRLEYGYFYVYDFDIKGFFDNIPHKKLLKVLNKYISDGTVLDLIWKSLKAGYMHDNVRYETPVGSIQGAVISPLLANIYLNELDWELEKAGIQFVRYADDSIAMCKSPEELEKAKEVVHRVLDELGLELAEDKTDDIDFHNKDFDFLGFTFSHLDKSKKGKVFYKVSPSEKSIKKFKEDVKGLTCKTHSHSFEQWTAILNPVLRGKFNYFMVIQRACSAVAAVLKERGRPFHAISYKGYAGLDGYVRQRLRVNFANRGKRHARFKNGLDFKAKCKYSNAFFFKEMGLVSGQFMHWRLYHPSMTVDEFLEKIKEKKKRSKSFESYNQFYILEYAK